MDAAVMHCPMTSVCTERFVAPPCADGDGTQAQMPAVTLGPHRRTRKPTLIGPTRVQRRIAQIQTRNASSLSTPAVEESPRPSCAMRSPISPRETMATPMKAAGGMPETVVCQEEEREDEGLVLVCLP